MSDRELADAVGHVDVDDDVDRADAEVVFLQDEDLVVRVGDEVVVVGRVGGGTASTATDVTPENQLMPVSSPAAAGVAIAAAASSGRVRMGFMLLSFRLKKG